MIPWHIGGHLLTGLKMLTLNLPFKVLYLMLIPTLMMSLHPYWATTWTPNL